MKLIVTIPCLNEDKTIAQVIRGIPREIPGIDEVEIVVVNDGSTDNTKAEALAAGASVIDLPGKGGLGVVFRAGFDYGIRRGADILVNVDGDGQFESGDVVKLIQPILNDQADFVTCTRFADPALRPEMPIAKYYGNKAVATIINWICGGTKFTDVACGFRAYNRETMYRLTLFGRFTYTQETFIDLFSKGLRIAEVPLKVRGVREHGTSRQAKSVLKYGSRSLPIILRAMRDIQPLKFFGGIALFFALLGTLAGGFITVWYFLKGRTTPYASLIPVGGSFFALSFLVGALALLADMLGRHRRITEELLYLARRKIYHSNRLPHLSLSASDFDASEAELWSEDSEKPARVKSPVKSPLRAAANDE